jgi:hypothetical protein
MINHPNRKKTYPDHTLEELCRKAGAGVSVLWEIPGPKNTAIAWLVAYHIGKNICIVQTFKDGGWTALTPNDSNCVDDTVADVLNRCAVGLPFDAAKQTI